MVMHARKQPRLNDGYADRKDAHLHKDMQYNSSLFADDSDDDGPLSSRISPRNQNKSSYTERNKEKRGSLSLAEKKVSHYLATGSLGRPIPMETSFAFSGEPSSGVPDTSRPTASAGQRAGAQSDRGIKEYNNYQGSKTEYKGSTPSSSSQHQEHRISSKQYPGGEFNSHTEKALSSVSNNGKQSISSSKEHGKDKEQVQKSAIRVCGDWSEHISSSGKRYYYNCKTEVSQWEKPNEWISQMCKTPDHRSKDGRPKLLSQSNANKISAENRASRHSSSSEHQPLEQARAQRNNSGDNASESQHGRETPLSNTHQHFRDNREFRDSQHLSRENSRDSSGRDIREMHKSSAERTRSGDSTTSNSYHQHNQLVPQKSGSTPGGNNGIPDLQHTDSKRSQHESHFSSSHGDYKRSCNELSRRRRTDSQGSQRYHDTGQGPIDDMEISPSPSPSPSSSYRSSAAGTPQLPPTSTPIATSSTPAHNPVSTPGSAHRSSSPQGNPIPTLVNRQTVNESGTYDKTIQQTLQELQKALSMHIHRAQQNTTNTRVAAGPQGEEMGRTSPVSATSSRSSCGSPTPSDSSSQNAAITSQALSAAALKREETAKLTASLSNYYNEKLIGHVLGWQADLVEKQAAKLWEESMVNGSLQISHISVQLKRARSQVRIAEIQSTLHEQRIMSSDQQRQEIENLKTPSSFLPS
ncbi:WW domain-containing adapter protein with coiled-coil-like isoform X2 [Physella acuta]|uniref:WW domain-containing adapter protein with coiled-coil-like isoform X2 n=1 Tax=Physella acuta TaxID=109671 RepID=UPI0027DC20ED|nr:WW domain-containing adapter protein with coiled-coil-like isoform X2 [Physella acuta]